MAASALQVLMELCFTLYASDAMSDAANEIGHLLKICSFYLIYRAIAVTALLDPMKLLFRDLTESERRLRETQALAHVGGWEFGLDSKAWTWTPEIYSFFGVDADAEPGLPAMLKPLDAQDQRKLRELLSRAASWGTPFELLLRIEVPGGKARFGQLRAEVQRDAQGNVTGLYGTLQDVSGQHLLVEDLQTRTALLEQRETELLAANKLAAGACKARSVFAANVNQALRSPLNAILGFSSLMEHEAGIPAAQRDAFGVIYRAGYYLFTLVEGVLETAKAETGQLRTENTPFAFEEALRAVTGKLKPPAEQKGLEFRIKQSQFFPQFIKADRSRLERILLHLTGNAVKFTREGSVTIRLRTQPEARNRLIIEVEDTGTGIEPEELKHLFQPLALLAGPDMRKGAGLGLTFARTYAHAMGGTISAESTPGKGSCFRFELPVELADEAEIEAGPGCAVQAAQIYGVEPGQPDYRILIAEDRPENQSFLTALMTRSGLQSRLAINGQRCVDLHQNWRPHLIFMSERMRAIGFSAAIKTIRGLPWGDKVKIVGITASTYQDGPQRLLEASADAVLREPYSPDDVYRCLARELGVRFLLRPTLPEEAGAEPVA
jgi:signal transduction histidine kinase